MTFVYQEVFLLKKIVLSIAILALVCSCSYENSSIALISTSGGEISIVEEKASILLKLDSNIIDHLCNLSELPVADMVKSLVPDTSVYIVPPRVFERRESYIGLLESQNDSCNRVEILRDNYNVLKDSALMDKLDLYSASFDSTMLSQVKDADISYEYDLSSILMEADTWDEAYSFFQDWKAMIVR